MQAGKKQNRLAPIKLNLEPRTIPEAPPVSRQAPVLRPDQYIRVDIPVKAFPPVDWHAYLQTQLAQQSYNDLTDARDYMFNFLRTMLWYSTTNWAHGVEYIPGIGQVVAIAHVTFPVTLVDVKLYTSTGSVRTHVARDVNELDNMLRTLIDCDFSFWPSRATLPTVHAFKVDPALRISYTLEEKPNPPASHLNYLASRRNTDLEVHDPSK